MEMGCLINSYSMLAVKREFVLTFSSTGNIDRESLTSTENIALLLWQVQFKKRTLMKHLVEA